MANQAYLNMFGYASDTELEGTPLLDQAAPQCRSQVEEITRSREQGKEAPWGKASHPPETKNSLTVNLK